MVTHGLRAGPSPPGAYLPIPLDADGDGADDVHWYAPGPSADFLWWSAGGPFAASGTAAVNL